MYKVVAERLDPNGPVYRMERNLNATSVDFVSPRDASGSYVNVWQRVTGRPFRYRSAATDETTSASSSTARTVRLSSTLGPSTVL